MTETVVAKLPPHNLEAERGLLGALLVDGDTLLDVQHTIRPEDFYDPKHASIFRAMVELAEKGDLVNLIALTDHFRANGDLGKIGGSSYLVELQREIGDPSNADDYAAIVKRKSIRRALMGTIQKASALAADEKQPIEEVVARISTDLFNIEYTGRRDHFKDTLTVAKAGLRRIEERKKRPNFVNGTPTPFKNLNEITNGLQAGDLVVLAGRPGMGKSALAQQLAEYAAEHSGPVVFFSLEMDADSLTERSFASNARVPSQKIRSGYLDSGEEDEILRAALKLEKLPILTVDTPGLTAQEIRFLSRQARAKLKGLSLVVVDYLGLVRAQGRGRQRYEEVGETTRTLKELARELKTPVLLLSQLNRSCESREDKRPLLSDLRESGDVEQDSDLVLLLYRDEYYCPFCSKGKKSDCAKGHKGLAEIKVAKQRKGPTGLVSLVWQEQFTRFENKAHEAGVQ